MAKKRKRKYSRAAGTEVKREMHRYKRGKAKSGKAGKAGKVKSRKQANESWLGSFFTSAMVMNFAMTEAWT